ncbi:hypothetical protein CLV54_1544 [Compostimonas suwonensis]|uniref:Uncharacterized protein n=1 Tax=Compostimonas suwonensis TaxID=1048394 RepID=A0A2M9C0M4_9MICO|nr:hypothetical protein CLV54_1544 [Compostimonas suwonensis]
MSRQRLTIGTFGDIGFLSASGGPETAARVMARLTVRRRSRVIVKSPVKWHIWGGKYRGDCSECHMGSMTLVLGCSVGRVDVCFSGVGVSAMPF